MARTKKSARKTPRNPEIEAHAKLARRLRKQLRRAEKAQQVGAIVVLKDQLAAAERALAALRLPVGVV